jgi:hypothetical protein
VKGKVYGIMVRRRNSEGERETGGKNIGTNKGGRRCKRVHRRSTKS